MIERRKESRHLEKNPVKIWPGQQSDENPAINAYTHDISTGGARIHSQLLFEVGSVINLEVHLARTNQSIALEAEVKWVRNNRTESMFELGVEFRHKMATTLLTLIRHLYSPEERIPTSLF